MSEAFSETEILNIERDVKGKPLSKA